MIVAGDLKNNQVEGHLMWDTDITAWGRCHALKTVYEDFRSVREGIQKKSIPPFWGDTLPKPSGSRRA